MKLLLLCLFAACCCSSISSTVEDQIGWHRLKEILIYVKAVEKNLMNSEYLINTPPQNIEDFCCLNALECFRANLQVHFNATKVTYVRKLIRGLRSNTTQRAMSFCHSNTTMSTCQDSSCHMHPKKSAKEFLKTLESLIQRAITQLAYLTKGNIL